MLSQCWRFGRREMACLSHAKSRSGRYTCWMQCRGRSAPITSRYGLVGIFGVILAAAGVAGVTAYAVTQRRHEIGIRVALGAQRTQVLALVMQEGATLVIVGTSIGLAGAWALIRVLSASVEPVARVVGRVTSQPLLLLGAPVLLAGVALGACYIPARQSTRIDAVRALRQE